MTRAVLVTSAGDLLEIVEVGPHFRSRPVWEFPIYKGLPNIDFTAPLEVDATDAGITVERARVSLRGAAIMGTKFGGIDVVVLEGPIEFLKLGWEMLPPARQRDFQERNRAHDMRNRILHMIAR